MGVDRAGRLQRLYSVETVDPKLACPALATQEWAGPTGKTAGGGGSDRVRHTGPRRPADRSGRSHGRNDPHLRRHGFDRGDRLLRRRPVSGRPAGGRRVDVARERIRESGCRQRSPSPMGVAGREPGHCRRKRQDGRDALAEAGPRGAGNAGRRWSQHLLLRRGEHRLPRPDQWQAALAVAGRQPPSESQRLHTESGHP